MRHARAAAAGWILLAATAASGGAGHRPAAIAIAYTSELHGNLLPCSCPAHALGGLARRIGWADSLRAASADPLLVVDAAALLPEQQDFPLLSRDGLASLRDLHMEAARAIGYDAIAGAGSGDLPLLGCNRARAIEVGGIRVLVAAVDERTDPAPAAAAVHALGPADLVLLLCDGDMHFGSRAARVVGAQVAVVARGARFDAPVWQDGVLLLGAGVAGKYTGCARLTIGANGEVRPAGVRLRAMDGTVPIDRGWQARVETAALAIERARPGALSAGE